MVILTHIKIHAPNSEPGQNIAPIDLDGSCEHGQGSRVQLDTLVSSTEVNQCRDILEGHKHGLQLSHIIQKPMYVIAGKVIGDDLGVVHVLADHQHLFVVVSLHTHELQTNQIVNGSTPRSLAVL